MVEVGRVGSRRCGSSLCGWTREWRVVRSRRRAGKERSLVCLEDARGRNEAVTRTRVLGNESVAGTGAVDTAGTTGDWDFFGFELDEFQTEAAQTIEEGGSVLVTAPTGAGKTAIAEIGVRSALDCGRRAIYTTPIKALSNQKYSELCEKFGNSVGLITGDAKIRPDADILVMTTEILRNILYCELNRGSPDGKDNTRLDFSRVQVIVLDEVHYLGDEERGTVWEEVIIYCGSEHLRHIQMISLSATLSNANEICSWMKQTRKQPTALVSCDSRPVPLTLHWTLYNAGKERTELEAVYSIDDSGNKVVASRYMKSLAGLKEPAPDFKTMLMILKQKKMLPAIWFIFKRSSCDFAARRAYKVLRNSNILNKRERTELFHMMSAIQDDHPESVKDDLVKPFLCGIASHHAGLLPAWKTLVEQAFRKGLIKLVFATHTLALGINMPAKTVVISDLEKRRGPYGRGVLTHNEIFQLAGRAGRRGFDSTGNCILMNSPNVSLSRVLRNLTGGPQPIDSSFHPGYGMVLNLINSLGIESARNMLRSSFKNFQCQLKADSVMAPSETQNDEVDLTSPEMNKLQQKREVQRYTLQMLLEQTLAARGAFVESFYEGQDQLPCLVAIDQGGKNIGQGDGSNLILSVLFQIELGGDSKRFLCLGDKSVFRVKSKEIAAVGEKIDGSNGDLLELVKRARDLDLDSLAWKEGHGGSGFSSALHHERVLDLLQSNQKEQLAFVGVDSETERHIYRERAKLSAIQGELRALEDADLHREDAGIDESYGEIKAWLGQGGQKFAERFRVEEVKGELVSRYLIEDRMTSAVIEGEDVSLPRARRSCHERMLGLLKNSEAYERVVKEFDARVRVLCEMDALDAASMELKPLGRVAAQLKAENELWFAICATSPEIYMLSSKELAGFMCALITRESLRLHNHVECSLPATDRVYASLERLQPQWEKLVDVQIASGVDEAPFIDARLSGLAEQWASGASWQAVRGSIDLDEGDIVKILHRTQDMLRQLGGLSLVPKELARTAKLAADSFQRSPLTDLS
ncbi:DExH-box ATP-dependent RNA helicase [Chloropicon primus]|uniref:DExH-box ATP-dependent RNA helicase n=2 Tax=Chloropicon primus TaxID=1764295 RepID=A0A5B8MHQ1_9CHLO|nr:DExH-box ATP-dependent RNA helicase [Chloropicon primus]|eukprot:QDZ19996.1 DExH-box ATP-dependent RNA helicase [Chloropicon primus]